VKRVRLSDLVRFDVQDGPNELTPPEVESVVYKFLRTFAVICSQVNLFLVIGRRFAFLSIVTTRLYHLLICSISCAMEDGIHWPP